MNTAYNSIKTATDVTTTPTQQPEANKPEWIFLNQSRRILIRDMRIEQDGYPTKYWQLLVRGINVLTGWRLWDVPKYGAVIVAEKNIPWYFRYYNALKTQPARDIETIETEARKFRAGLEQRIKSRRKGFYYGIETSNTAEEYISVIIELYSAKARKDGNISEVEMHDIIGKQIRYAIEAFDKTGDRFPDIRDMAIDFRNVASTYNSIKSVCDANHHAPALQATEATTETPVQEPEEVTTEEVTPAPAPPPRPTRPRSDQNDKGNDKASSRNA